MYAESEIEELRLAHWDDIQLGDRSTRIAPVYADEDDYEERLAVYRDRIKDCQARFFANNEHALLVIVQGADAAGKNGLIRRAFSGVDPAGMHVWSFAEPTHTELRQDFLRRYQRRMPLRGRIGVFNRSYYEHVMVVRVHPEWLVERRLTESSSVPPEFWRQRFEDINAFERYLTRNHIRVVKLFLHLSHDEQRERFMRRLENPEKSWKLSRADLRDRVHWDRFQSVFADCLAATATEDAPWYVIPADDKLNARLLGSAVVLHELEALAGEWPRPTAARRDELEEARRCLEAEMNPRMG